jgi:hypothetical protein
MIRDVYPGSRIRTHSGSRIQGSKNAVSSTLVLWTGDRRSLAWAPWPSPGTSSARYRPPSPSPAHTMRWGYFPMRVVEDQAFTPSYDLTSPPPPPPPSVSSTGHTHSKAEKERQLADGKGRRSQNIRWSSIIISVLSGKSLRTWWTMRKWAQIKKVFQRKR